MTEETKKKAPAKKAAAAPKAEKSAKAPKAEAAAPKKTPAPKALASGKTVTLKQIGSPIGRQEKQRATLIGLGLNKLNRERTLQDSPAVRGMIKKVKHLVQVVGE